jgi:hypothetical protein
MVSIKLFWPIVCFYMNFGFIHIGLVFMKKMDWIFVRSLRIRVDSTQVRVLVLLQFNFLQNSWSFV